MMQGANRWRAVVHIALGPLLTRMLTHFDGGDRPDRCYPSSSSGVRSMGLGMLGSKAEAERDRGPGTVFSHSIGMGTAPAEFTAGKWDSVTMQALRWKDARTVLR